MKIKVVLPPKTDISALTPSIKVADGATVTPAADMYRTSPILWSIKL